MHAGPTPPSGTARAIVGGGESLVVAELGSGRADRVPELLPDILYLALTPYVGQEAALSTPPPPAAPEAPRRRPGGHDSRPRFRPGSGAGPTPSLS